MSYRIRLFFLALWLAFGTGAWAQTSYGDLPEKIDPNDATITKFGHATMTVEMKIVTDPVTQKVDTLRSVKNIEWNTEKGTAKRRMSERGNPLRSDFYDEGNNWWYDIYWYTYTYTSVTTNGEPVMLSAMACMPDEDCDYINNVIIACHITLAKNGQCPSEYNNSGSATSDVSLLMNLAGSGTALHAPQSSQTNYNLVILPDYEGFGITRSHTQPYLCEELTARQVVDAVRYGINLYNTSSVVSSIRHRIRLGEGLGLEKLLLNANHDKLYIPLEGKDYAVAFADTLAVMPLNLKVEGGNIYMLYFDKEGLAFEYLHLIDNLTDTDVDLLETPYYTFNVLDTEFEDRFLVVFDPEGMDEPTDHVTEYEAEGPFAFISNGEIRLSKTYHGASLQVIDMTGRIVVSKTGDLSGSISTSSMTSGVYVLRLINGSDVKTQKLVVE